MVIQEGNETTKDTKEVILRQWATTGDMTAGEGLWQRSGEKGDKTQDNTVNDKAELRERGDETCNEMGNERDGEGVRTR